MNVYYTVVCANIYDAETTYTTTQLTNLASIMDEVTGRAYDHVDLTISDGETTVTVEVAS